MFYPWFISLVLSISIASCSDGHKNDVSTSSDKIEKVLPGAYDVQAYLPMIKDKKVGLVVNHTSFIDQTHLVDSLVASNVEVHAIFAPEHGFRGDASAGADIDDEVDISSGAPVYSIYGKNKKPTPAQLMGIDIMIFDIQDVGARFYTYISTLEYVMTACAEADIPIIVLDRPNPNGNYIDGPILDLEHRSFVGRQRIPIVHGLTVGEYALMLNGEKWLADGIVCDPAKLTVIKCMNYTHESEYLLPIAPSPNLPNQRSIYLYPSLCLIEGTTASLGRGTEKQFQVILHPDLPDNGFSETPIKRPGAKWPKHENKLCYGYDLTQDELVRPTRINLRYILQTYDGLGRPDDFFLENNFIDKLYGSDNLRLLLTGNSTADISKLEMKIRADWEDGLQEFKKKRSKYLLYP